MVRAHHLEHALLVRAEEVADAPDLVARDAPFLPAQRPRGVDAEDDHLRVGIDRAEIGRPVATIAVPGPRHARDRVPYRRQIVLSRDAQESTRQRSAGPPGRPAL